MVGSNARAAAAPFESPARALAWYNQLMVATDMSSEGVITGLKKQRLRQVSHRVKQISAREEGTGRVLEHSCRLFRYAQKAVDAFHRLA